MSISEPGWGPSHQYLAPPRPRKGHLPAFALAAVLVLLNHTLALYALGLLALLVLGRVLQRHWDSPGDDTPVPLPTPLDAAALRARSARLGGGAYLGLDRGSWVTADPEHAVMVLGPPRSGKTSSIVIPSVLAAPGPVVSTATKPDVLNATFRSRSEVGQVWLYDPSGERADWPKGIRRLCWSPVPAARTWDGALLIARAMASSGASAKGTTNEHHWRERSTALLAPLLHAASITDRPITQVLTWVLRGELDEPSRVLSRPWIQARRRRPLRHRENRGPRALLHPLRHSRRPLRLQRRLHPPQRLPTQLRRPPICRLLRHDLHHRPLTQASPLRTPRRRPA